MVTISGTGYDGASGSVFVNGQQVNTASHPALAQILEIGYVCNNADVNNGKVGCVPLCSVGNADASNTV